MGPHEAFAWPQRTQEAERLELLLATQRAIADCGADLGSVTRLIAERAMALSGGDGAMVSMLDGDELDTVAAAGIAARHQNTRRPLSTSLVRHAVEARATLLITDTERDPRINQAMRARTGDRSHICVPLFRGADPVAALSVMASDAARPLDEDARRTLELLAVMLSSAVSNAAALEAEREEVAALSRFEAIFTGSVMGIVVLDADGTIMEHNPAFRELLGVGAELVGGRRLSVFLPAEDQPVARGLLAEVMRGERDAVRFEHRLVRGDGGTLWVSASISVVRAAAGGADFAIAAVQDITQARLAEQALAEQAEVNRHQALHDALTGLANRTLFQDRTEQAILAAERKGGSAAVLLIDLDRFKQVNDSLGHPAGDALLIELAGRLRQAVRASDTVARLGGDEFALLLHDTAGPEDALVVAERVKTALVEPVTVDGLALSVEASIGIALYPRDGTDTETLVRRADAAMYHAKAGTLGYTFHEHDHEVQDTWRLTLIDELRHAIDRDELLIHYQPKARLMDGAVRSCEALLRWRHPERGLLSAEEFIPLAQHTGLIGPISLRVIDGALRQIRAWLDDGVELAVAVNLAPRNLLDSGFPAQVAALLDRHGIEPELLELEVTESAVISDLVRTKSVLDRLSAMGIRLSIDDFGTGFSSLAHLRRLPVDEIKIDRSFVAGIETDRNDAAIVRSMIELGASLELDVVAEGVETKRVWDWLSELGCTSAQGFLLCRPLPGEQLREWLASRPRSSA